MSSTENPQNSKEGKGKKLVDNFFRAVAFIAMAGSVVTGVTGVGLPATAALVAIAVAAEAVVHRDKIADFFKTAASYFKSDDEKEPSKNQEQSAQVENQQEQLPKYEDLPPAYQEQDLNKVKELQKHNWAKEVEEQGHHHRTEVGDWQKQAEAQGHHHHDPDHHWSDEISQQHISSKDDPHWVEDVEKQGHHSVKKIDPEEYHHHDQDSNKSH